MSFDCPTPDEIRMRLKRLFSKGYGPYEEMPPGYPKEETTLEEWLDIELAESSRTPRQILECGNQEELFFLDRFVNGIATSRVASHPQVVRDIVRKRIETMFRDGLSLALIGGPRMGLVEESQKEFERWMNAVNPMFGGISPREFFDGKEVEVELLRVISGRLDAIDDGAFS